MDVDRKIEHFRNENYIMYEGFGVHVRNLWLKVHVVHVLVCVSDTGE